MKQRAHAWVALRALKLVNDSGRAPKLVELLSYYLSDAWNGAWLPDTLIRDMSYGHIFKMTSDPQQLGGSIEERRKVTYSQLKSSMTGKRLCLEYAKKSEELKKPVWVHEKVSGHLPDRVIALNHAIIDMLKMGDYPLAFYAKKTTPKAYLTKDLASKKIKDLSLSPNFSARQIAITYFMASHYIADAHMPLHCDLRDYGSKKQKIKRTIPKTLHPSIEEKWEDSFPDKKTLAIHDYTTDTLNDIVTKLPTGTLIEIDTKQEYRLNNRITKPKKNEWQEMVNTCRTSHAFSKEWIKTPHKDAQALIQADGKDQFQKATNHIFHDAVESVARIWRKAWTIYEK
ncbi:hypothetical protein BMS3Bbin16_00651 [archaeon BMS3Bbin16]|nr:hypothetical protein BMS3Bbin16_00651 [archaeon BMS3Bbin16]